MISEDDQAEVGSGGREGISVLITEVLMREHLASLGEKKAPGTNGMGMMIDHFGIIFHLPCVVPVLLTEEHGLKQLLKKLSCIHQSKLNFTVALEGNIGCGKTTFINYFLKYPTVCSVTEPVEKWTNVGGTNSLKLLYEDPKRWSFLFNHYASLTRLSIHLQKTAEPVKMIERSFFSTRFVFVENSYKCGHLTELEYAILCEWYDFVASTHNVQVDLFVYLRTSPEICLQRIRSRNRKEETSISLDFVRELHNLHEELFIHQSAKKLFGSVLVLDATNDLPKMFQTYHDNRFKILGGHVGPEDNMCDQRGNR